MALVGAATEALVAAMRGEEGQAEEGGVASPRLSGPEAGLRATRWVWGCFEAYCSSGKVRCETR